VAFATLLVMIDRSVAMKRNRVQICCIVTSANPTLPELMNFQLLLTTSNEAQGMRVQLREALLGGTSSTSATGRKSNSPSQVTSDDATCPRARHHRRQTLPLQDDGTACLCPFKPAHPTPSPSLSPSTSALSVTTPKNILTHSKLPGD
jgi:hypothetical protein